MNLLLYCVTFWPRRGGAESFFGDLAGLLARQGHSVTIVAESLGRFPAEEERDGYSIRRFDFPVPSRRLLQRPLQMARAAGILVRLARLIRRKRIETVCIGLFDPRALYFLLLRPVLRFRLTVQVRGGVEPPYFEGKRPGAEGILRLCLKQCDAVAAVSPSLARAILRFAPFVEGKLQVIPSGVDPAVIRDPVRFPHAGRCILYAGRLVPIKQVDKIISAYSEICGQIPDVDLFIAGTGCEESNLKALARSLGLENRVRFWGECSREQVFSLMQGALFLVLASRSEGCSMAMLEAFGAGRLVVGSRVDGIREFIEEGKNGFLFDPERPEELGRLMVKCVTDDHLRAAMEKYVRADVTRRFDFHRQAEEHLRVLRGVGRDGINQCISGEIGAETGI